VHARLSMNENDARGETTLPQGTANLLSAALRKQVTTIRIADQRAQTIITINAFLIPLILSQIDNPRCTQAGPVFLTLAFLSIFCALIGLLQNRIRLNSDTHPGLIHFSSIRKMTEADYLDSMRRTLHENKDLEMHIAHDMYHLSRDILRPKFLWIRASGITSSSSRAYLLQAYCTSRHPIASSLPTSTWVGTWQLESSMLPSRSLVHPDRISCFNSEWPQQSKNK